MKYLYIVFEFLKKYWLYIVGFIAVFIMARKLGIVKQVQTITEIQVIGATIDKSRALYLANKLHEAMSPPGTDSVTLDSVYLELKQNPANLGLVSNAFGVRPYAFFGSPAWFWVPSDNLSLLSWILNETSGAEAQKWRNLFGLIGL